VVQKDIASLKPENPQSAKISSLSSYGQVQNCVTLTMVLAQNSSILQ